MAHPVFESLANSSAASPWLDAVPDEFRRCFGGLPFELRHNLAGSPLFSLAQLDRAAQKASQGGTNAKFVNNTGLNHAAAKFDEAVSRPRVAGAVEELPVANAWMKISNICAVDPAYRDVLDQILREIEQVSGAPLRDRIVWSQMTVFMASPDVVTPYHIDHEQNFLCQVSGEKEIALYDPADRENLPDQEIERFYTGDLNGAQYREQFKARGKVYGLRPGVAVHLPSLGGHWVRNGPNVSISVSVNFCTREIDRRAHVYQMNHYLRKLGISPRPPGQSQVVDAMKAAYFDLLSVHPVRCYDDAVFSGIERQRAIAARAMPWRQTHEVAHG